jgi:hypothetical protein
VKRLPLVIVAALASGCAGRSTPPATPAPAPAAPAAPAEPATLRYTPGTGHYRLESQTHVVQEMMGASNATDITTAAVFTADVAPAEGNLGIAITIDSLGVTAPMGAADPAELSAAKGKVVRLVVSPTGAPVSLTPPEGVGAVVLQMAQGLREFLPLLPPGSTAAGATWSDTTTTTTPNMGITVTVKMTRQHRIAGWEDRAGTHALHIATAASYTVSGAGDVQGQSIELSGGGQATSDAYVSAAGVYLGSAASDSALVNANVVSAGMVVPVRRTTRSTFTRLP